MTEKTMLERVAKALFEDEWDDKSSEPWESADPDERKAWLRSARVAMAALRDPTDLMGIGLINLPGGYRAGSHSASDIWRVMIDAALEEKPE